jgi:Winged helix-turn helix
MEVRHVYSSGVARRLQGISAARTCAEDEGWTAGSAAFDASGHLRWGDPHRGSEAWWRDASDHPGLGDAVNARGAAGLLDGKSPGQPSRLNDVQRQAIVRMIETGPIPAIHGVVRWRLIDLSQWIYEEFRIMVAKQTLSRELRAMGYRKLSARPPPSCASRGSHRGF